MEATINNLPISQKSDKEAILDLLKEEPESHEKSLGRMMRRANSQTGLSSAVVNKLISKNEKLFQKGDRVRYSDGVRVEFGVVSRSQVPGEDAVFVKYDNLIMKMQTGDEPYTSQRTNVSDLTFEETIN